jgi:hypothetical protein
VNWVECASGSNLIYVDLGKRGSRGLSLSFLTKGMAQVMAKTYKTASNAFVSISHNVLENIGNKLLFISTYCIQVYPVFKTYILDKLGDWPILDSTIHSVLILPTE